ncbi:DUF2510 domain-containing protein [Agrococcus jejuensis]|uniref:DUF2510 domain-containing protein n=1 Tax=Agrococcus jejuensis TaxID=399736 RepID=UPI0011A6F8F3|nr:DUF2510 domain-containing protein [Agrococcus jejuensis]
MSAHSTPPGWYPMPDGQSRFWDGQTWLDLPDPTGGAPRRRAWLGWVIGGASALVLAVAVIAGIAIVGELQRQQSAAAEAQAQEQAEAQAHEDAAQEAQAAAAAEAAEQSERDARSASVEQIELSIWTMAQGHASDGLLDDAPIDVSCSPVGGSLDDLTALTTTFDCFVAVEDMGDGTMRGYHYNSLMNWSSGEYTYGFGAP